MPLETASTIADLVTTNPVGASDTPAALDDHIRLIKTVLKADALVNADIGVAVQAYDSTILKSANIGSTVQGYDADTLKVDTADVLTAGFAATPYNAGTKSTGTFTPDEANGNFQYCVNGGAFTLAPPTNNCTIVVQITNNASAGTITTSGFTKVTGTAPVTTDGYDFFAYITKCNGFSHLAWQALQ